MVESGEKMLADLAEELGPIPEDAITPENERAFRKLAYGNDAEKFTFEEGGIVPIEFARDVMEAESRFNLTQKADFHQAIADVARMMAVVNQTTFPIKVYLFMAVFWRAIEVYPTFESFYNLAVKVFGPASVGSDPKHLAQILGRVGKRFRRPGRPPKLLQAP
jgi:hypothetical protein